MTNVVPMVRGDAVQTLENVAFMLSEGGRCPITEADIVTMCDGIDPRCVRVALHGAVMAGEMGRGADPRTFTVGPRMVASAREAL